jgi:hypothetical protein
MGAVSDVREVVLEFALTAEPRTQRSREEERHCGRHRHIAVIIASSSRNGRPGPTAGACRLPADDAGLGETCDLLVRAAEAA